MRQRTALLLISLTLTALWMAFPAFAQDGSPGPGDPVRGAQLFADNCAVCHGAQGEGRVGATLNKVFVSINADAQLKEIITNGRTGTFMPTWGQSRGGPLSDGDIADVIAYIKSWGKTYEPPAPAPRLPVEKIPPVPQVNGDPNKGYVLFQQNCMVCHGEHGEGRIGATLNTSFPAINPGAFAIETIKRGIPGTLMPAWLQANGGPLSEGDINDVAAYVLSIQAQPVSRPDEVVEQANALPLALIGALSLLLVITLAVIVQRRDTAK